MRLRTWKTIYAGGCRCGLRQSLDGPEFRFNDEKNTEHAYRLMQTVVRRIPAPGSPGNSKGRAIPHAESRAGFEQ